MRKIREWILYSDEVAWSGSSFAKGIKEIGDKVRFRNPMAWKDHEFQPTDIAVVFGWRDNQQKCLRSHTSRSIPTVVVDLGYVDRFQDYPDVDRADSFLQVSIGDKLNIIPNHECPRDRFEKLQLAYPGKFNDPDGYALFCGQWPTDAAHPFKDELSITSFMSELQERIPDIKIRYRCHPKLITNNIDARALEEDLEGARCILTYNSNVGHDALRAGMPIFCHKSAAYSELASSLLTGNQLEDRIKDPPFPSKLQWEDYFSRLAYGQWNFKELATGSCQEYIISRVFK